MSTPQKSFFEQNHGAKTKSRPRPNWNRTNSADNVLQPKADKTKNIMPGPAFDPSSQAKTKLKAFQFIEGRPSPRPATNEGNKENEDGAPEDAQQPAQEVLTDKTVETLTVTTVAKGLPPSTPAARLPLADLIGMMEEPANRPMPATSPEERVIWQPGANDSTPNERPTRKRKRARSSSPVSSSQNEASNFFAGNNEAFDLQNLHQSLRTPQADPAADLWSRYGVDTDSKQTPSAVKAVAFAHLIEKSSPHSSATAGSVSGLRRWASCGVEWPSATKPTKRRKTAGTFREGKAATTNDAIEREDARGAKGSKVGRLVEKIQETLAKPNNNSSPQGPSSSSPLPDTRGPEVADCVSPLQRLDPVVEALEAEPSPSAREGSAREVPQAVAPRKSPRSSSSEFGDVDIDMDMIEAVESQHALETNPAAAVEQLDVEETLGNTAAPDLQPAESQHDVGCLDPQAERDNDFDEFEDDGDAFAADLEIVASMYDTRPIIAEPTQDEARLGAPVAAAAQVPRGEHRSTANDTPPANVASFVDLDSDDDFGGDDIDVEQFVAAEAVATQHLQDTVASQAQSEQSSRAIQRYLVTKIVEGQFQDDKGRPQLEKVLLVKDEKREAVKAITLRQAWYETPCTEGSYVHVVGQFSSSGQCFVDNSQNLLILHPDHLVSATVVADSFSCLRRAVLQDRVKATGQASPPQLYGNILHGLFQEAMKLNSWQTPELEAIIRSLLPKHYETMAEIGLNENQVMEHLKSKLPEMQSWAATYVQARPTADSTVKDRNGHLVSMSINKLLDVEEQIWSPRYGLKGNVDATVQVLMSDKDGERTLTVPFEVKTGKRSNEAHLAQTMLYTLLMGDRYDLDVFYGVLYYLETSETKRIPAVRQELMQMVMKRNEVARYVRERLQLPPVLKESHLCGKCYAQTTCFLYHKLSEDGDGGDFKAKEKFDELARHLKPAHRDFFVKWDYLLTKEESDMMRFRRELWTMLSHEREKLGRCFSHVVIETGSLAEQKEGGKINRFQYTLVKQKPRAGFSFNESQITVGEPIVISDEKGHFALANGYVTNVRRKRITVAVDRRLHNARTKRRGFDADINQEFVGIIEVPKDGSQPVASPEDNEPPTVYRLDKDEFSNGMATVRNNIISIMDNNVFKAADLRSLVIEDRPPQFKVTPSKNPLAQSMSLQMNDDQEAAVAKVMAAQDYALVLGMPGTGKTTTIAHIIRALVAKGKSVLLTSYTHTAVDNILLKIKDAGFSVLRLGAVAKVHPDVQEFAILAARPKDSLEEVVDSWHKPPVVATTCLGINHALFTQRTFDYCIVDEASQITLPVCFGPIRMAKTFVLVGDHYQLPPLVQNKEALEGGLDISLFRLLSERHPEAVTSLEHQYRMAEDVMLLSNELIYSGRLKCGNEAVALRELHVPHPQGISALHHGITSGRIPSQTMPICRGPFSPSCHLSQIISSRKVLFLNTANLPSSSETISGPRIINSLEARLTMQAVYGFLTCGIAPSEVGVITFYRSQLALLKQSLGHLSSTSSFSHGKGSRAVNAAADVAGVEMHTADKFQGRDKEAVIVSFVRSNDACNVGDLLKDWRRVNVAVTRARSKLILIGSRKTLAGGGNDVLKGLVRICDEKRWTVNLGPEALDGHVCIDGGGSQTQATTGKVAESPASPGERRTMGNAKSPTKSPLATKVPLKRKVLGDIEGPNASPSPPKMRTGAKVAEKTGRMGQKGMVNQRPILRDIVKELL